jgi:hypothetical protein
MCEPEGAAAILPTILTLPRSIRVWGVEGSSRAAHRGLEGCRTAYLRFWKALGVTADFEVSRVNVESRHVAQRSASVTLRKSDFMRHSSRLCEALPAHLRVVAVDWHRHAAASLATTSGGCLALHTACSIGCCLLCCRRQSVSATPSAHASASAETSQPCL